MLRRITDRLDFTRRLGFRLGGLLSVAILPIGLISLVQNLHLSREAERSAEIALLGRTAAGAAARRRRSGRAGPHGGRAAAARAPRRPRGSLPSPSLPFPLPASLTPITAGGLFHNDDVPINEMQSRCSMA